MPIGAGAVRKGDIVQITSTDPNDNLVYGWGIYMGEEYTWKMWHVVRNLLGKMERWDEPYWQIQKVATCLQKPL